MLSDSGPLSVGQSFGKRYHIKRALGLGGMGAVYQAWDTELSVDVAIKLIRRELVATPDAAAESNAGSSASCSRAPRDAPQCRANSRSRRGRRQQIHHDVVRRRHGPREPARA